MLRVSSRADGGDHQQRDDQHEGTIVLLGGIGVGRAGLGGVELKELFHGLVDLLGIAQQVMVEQFAHRFELIGLAVSAQAHFQLTVLGQDLAEFVEGGALTGFENQRRISVAGLVDLRVTLVHEAQGFVLQVAIDHQAVGEGAQALVVGGQFVEQLDAGNVDLFDVHARLTDMPHLQQ